MSGSPKCTDCEHAFLVDNGYSNYTVMGTELFCGLDLHPKAPFDIFYDEASELGLAAKCDSFTEGLPVEIDVERDDYDGNEGLAKWYAYAGEGA